MQNLISFFTQSSEDPTKTSATLTGILIALASNIQQAGTYLPYIHSFFVSPIGQQIDPILTSVGTIVGGIWALFGILRKITNKVGDTVTPA